MPCAAARRRPQSGEPGGDRNDLGDRHPVDAVHEVDQVDEPDAADQQHSALDPPGQQRDDPRLGGQSCEQQDDGDGLQEKPRRDADSADVVDRADQRDECGRAENKAQRRGLEPRLRPRHHGRCGDADGRSDYGDAAALRRRHPMRGARVRPRQRVTLEQRPQRDDQSGAERSGGGDDENERAASHGPRSDNA